MPRRDSAFVTIFLLPRWFRYKRDSRDLSHSIRKRMKDESSDMFLFSFFFSFFFCLFRFQFELFLYVLPLTIQRRSKWIHAGTLPSQNGTILLRTPAPERGQGST